MGIQGLLPFLANSARDAHISEFENQYVAIDAYCWLHKGIYSCSYELAMKKPTNKYVLYCVRYIEMLRHFKVKPILVFDGRNLSSKEETEKKRREERTRKYKKGLELMRAGKINEGRQLLGESVDVKHELVLNLMKECREMNVDCIVAPFEADAQLSYFSLQKIVGCIITEDSDLLAYGCEKVMFKMDKSGRGRLIEKSNIFMSLKMEADEFSEDKFRYMCILSGCDYLPSLPSIGPANALKFVKLIGDKNIIEVLPRLPTYLNKLKITVSPEYIQGFIIADNTFKHQLVYDPFQRKQKPLRPVLNEDEIVGEKLPDSEAFQLAIGNIDPITMTKMDNFNPDRCPQGFDILWKSSNIQKAPSMDFNPSQNAAVKRLSEVTLVKNDLKKYCIPQDSTKNKNLQVKKTLSGVPQSSFIFEAKNSIAPTDTVKEVNFLKSRYFTSKKKSPMKAKPNRPKATIGKKKDESYEEYLQRLYEEHFSDEETDGEKSDGGSRHKSVITNGLSTDKSVSGKRLDQNNLTQQLDACISEFQKIKKIKKENLENHSLLNEFAKMEEKKIGAENVESVNKSEENSKRDKIFTPVKEKSGFVKESPVEKLLCLDPAMDSPSREDRKAKPEIKDLSEILEKENKIENSCTIKTNQTSPVFKVRHRHRILNENYKVEEEILDTASTPISFYFSPSFSETLNKSSSTADSIMKMETTPKRSIPVNGLSSKTNKSGCKSFSSRQTLFQFGFKKENKEDVVVNAT